MKPVRRRKSAMGQKLAKIANEPGVRDPININVWLESSEGEPVSEAGRQVSLTYHRADGGPRLNAQKVKPW